jgi:plasmid stability protein
MSTTLTLKNIPDDIYERLKASAEANRRSLSSEAIVCLEAVLFPSRVDPAVRIARARALRASLPTVKFSVRDIDELERAGRP